MLSDHVPEDPRTGSAAFHGGASFEKMVRVAVIKSDGDLTYKNRSIFEPVVGAFDPFVVEGNQAFF